jgi:hypothetical protein
MGYVGQLLPTLCGKFVYTGVFEGLLVLNDGGVAATVAGTRRDSATATIAGACLGN